MKNELHTHYMRLITTQVLSSAQLFCLKKFGKQGTKFHRLSYCYQGGETVMTEDKNTFIKWYKLSLLS